MRYFAEYAVLPAGLTRNVLLSVEEGRFSAVTAGAEPAGAERLPGVVLPGFANAHSHAFHRALRGRTHDGGGTFWTWRNRMYQVAARLDPDSYFALASAVYAEMVLAGVTTVGEFHYLHHDAGGVPYREPNAMAEALRAAAADAGLRLTLLDACYLAGGLDGGGAGGGGHLPLDGVQRRFGDRDADTWAARVAMLEPSDRMRVGVAAHSVRAVPPRALATVRAAAAGRPVHVHLSEQPAENEACVAVYGLTPTELLGDEGMLGATTTVVHATHLSESDIGILGGAGVTACLCPTTERDLADGIGPARALHDAGVRLSLGSDQHAVIDMLEEARALEMHERLLSLRRGRLQPAELLTAMTAHASLGWPESGSLAAGAAADLVAIRLDTVRTAGVAPEQIVLAASAADVDTVMVQGRVVVAGGRHHLGDVASLLREAIEPLWRKR